MIIRLFGIYHEIRKVTAIALCDNGKEECRQDALLVAREDHGEIITDVVFGWDIERRKHDLRICYGKQRLCQN